MIKHSKIPDVLITHLPEITFNAFVCNFGGLLGLWLGLSVFAIFRGIRDILLKLFDKRQQTFNICFKPNIINNIKISNRDEFFKQIRQSVHGRF